MASGNPTTTFGSQQVSGEVRQASGGGDQKKTGSSWSKAGSKGQMSTISYNFEGAKKEIGVVLGLKHERQDEDESDV